MTDCSCLSLCCHQSGVSLNVPPTAQSDWSHVTTANQHGGFAVHEAALKQAVTPVSLRAFYRMKDSKHEVEVTE